MSQNQMIFLFVASAVALYFFFYIKKRPAALLALLLRCAAGLMYIFSFNTFLAARGIAAGPGLNPVTLTLSALLGIPGAMLAFAVNLFRFL